MSHLTYRDLSIIRSAGAQPSWSGMSWFLKDVKGNEWQIEEDQDTGILLFHDRYKTINMTREDFSEIFGA